MQKFSINLFVIPSLIVHHLKLCKKIRSECSTSKVKVLFPALLGMKTSKVIEKVLFYFISELSLTHLAFIPFIMAHYAFKSRPSYHSTLDSN